MTKGYYRSVVWCREHW